MNSKTTRILHSFKRIEPIYYDIYQVEEADYVILSTYSQRANHIAIHDVAGVVQLADICFKCEKDKTGNFTQILESYGVKFDGNVIADRMKRMHLSLEQKDFFIELLTDDEDGFMF